MTFERGSTGTWKLISRIDCTRSGERRLEPSLGEDPWHCSFMTVREFRRTVYEAGSLWSDH